MYTPKYAVTSQDGEVLEFIRQNGFGILVSFDEGKLLATHTPMFLNSDGNELSGHIAKANVQWKSFNKDHEVLAIFQGPHTYISPSWYDHENVPTWNYIAAHIYGHLKIIEGEELLDSLKNLVNKYEKQSKKPISVEGMSADYLAKEMRGLVGFKIQIDRIEASFKLSQNRDGKNFSQIIEKLKERGDHQSIEIAKEMERIIHPKSVGYGIKSF